MFIHIAILSHPDMMARDSLTIETKINFYVGV